jgi:glycosyltransferase involved in cell wall biosynthesis
LRYLWARPQRYFKTLADVLRHTWGSANFFVGAIGIFPKSVQFAHEMESTGVDHVHAHFVNHPAVAGFIITQLTGIPFSFTAHGSDLHVERRMLRQKVDASSFAITISEYNREVILSECGRHLEDKVHVVHCGIDHVLFAPNGVRKGERPMRIISVGSLIDVKGHRYLIEACDLLRKRGIDFVCDLVGEGMLRRQLERQVAQAGLQDQVRFHGAQPRLSVAQMYREADVAALTSVPTRKGKREGIPVVLMEAMASGLPVVSSRISGIPELVQHGRTGYLTAARDSVAIADALENLSRNPALRLQMGKEGRARVLQEFDQECSARILLGLFAAVKRGSTCEAA